MVAKYCFADPSTNIVKAQGRVGKVSDSMCDGQVKKGEHSNLDCRGP